MSPEMIVDIPLGDAPAADALAVVDGVLGGDFGALEVRLLVADGHPQRDTLAELFAGDSRVRVEAPRAERPAAAVHVVMPPSARPGERTMGAIHRLVVEDGAGPIEIAVPGRFRVPLSRDRVRAAASGAGGATRRVGSGEVDLSSSLGPTPKPAPPQAGLSDERAEHLRHRARAATNRSRMERNAQRVARERMRVAHEKARAALIDRRIAASGAGHWLSWRARRLWAILLTLARQPRQLFKRVRAQVRRLRRKTVDWVRRRRSPAPKVKRPGQEYLQGPDV